MRVLVLAVAALGLVAFASTAEAGCAGQKHERTTEAPPPPPESPST